MYVIHHNADLQIDMKTLKELILYSHKYITDSELQSEEDKTVITVEVSWNIFNIKIQDIHRTSTEVLCALQEDDRRVIIYLIY
jgi:hypothetical protein